jgi:hypothetical protein
MMSEREKIRSQYPHSTITIARNWGVKESEVVEAVEALYGKCNGDFLDENFLEERYASGVTTFRLTEAGLLRLGLDFGVRANQNKQKIVERAIKAEKLLKTLAETYRPDGYITIEEYCRKRGFAVVWEKRGMWGKRAVAICKEENIKIFKMPDKKYDFVNAYPEAILDKAAKEINGE